ncbi:amino acid permease [Mycoplasma corogypsi]|uniref:amino acid permease n=1 Tax=Mycoplasma corogypsi TaxID=2106 RepID=UPI0038730194
MVSKNNSHYKTIEWAIRITSLVFFLAIVFLSTIGLKTNKIVIMIFGILKWLILVIGVLILVYIVSTNNQYQANITQSQNISARLLFANTILFIYAFGGIEDVSAMVKDVKMKNFRKVLLTALMFILGFYLLIYSLVLGFNIQLFKNSSLQIIYQSAFGAFGTVLFIIGFLSNDITSRITQSVATARKIVPMAEDGNLFPYLAQRSKKGEFKHAIWFTTSVTLITMIILWSIPLIIYNNDQERANRFFETAIYATNIAVFVEDLLTFTVAFILEKKQIISKIPLWEKIIYVFDMIAIVFLLIVFLTPGIFGDKASETDHLTPLIAISTYFIFIIFGIIMNILSRMYIRNKQKVTSDLNV